MPVARDICVIVALATALLSGCVATGQRGLSASSPHALPVPATTATVPAPTADNASPCEASHLTLARAGNDAGMGHRAFAFSYTNAAMSPCRLGGYPQVQALDASGAAVPDIPTTDATNAYLVPGTSVETHTLAPGQSLWFVVTWSVIPHGDTPCPGMAALRIAPPGTRPTAPAGPASSVPNPTVDAMASQGLGEPDTTLDTGPETGPATATGTVLRQVSSVCDGLRVLPLRAGPPQG